MPNVFLDYASSAPCDPRVFEAMRPYFFEQSGNPSSPHQQGRQARKAVAGARDLLAGLINASSSEIVFTSGATESNNQAIFSTARALKNKGRHIIASAIEHHSVLGPLHQLQEDGFQVEFIKPGADGIVDAEILRSAMRPDTILLCLIHANNEIGTLQPAAETGRLCRQRGIRFLVDATQSVGHVPVDVRGLYCDFLSLSAHKFYGPQGVGALYVRQGLDGPSYVLGGDQEQGRRAGTPNTAGIAGLGEAVKLCSHTMRHEGERETALREKIIDFVLDKMPAAVLNGDRQKRLPNNAHFSFPGVNGEELVSALDQAGFSLSMGSACTSGRLEPSHVLSAIGLTGSMALSSLRISIGRWTTPQDVDRFLEELEKKAGQLSRGD